jgi:hypothetical protein
MHYKYYFLLKQYNKPDDTHYAHASICMAEGLKEAGIDYAANIDYFPDLSGNVLFNKANENDTYDYILTDSPDSFKNELEISYKHNKKIIIFDSNDECFRPKSIPFANIAYKYFITTNKAKTPLFKPFCFSITNRMINVANAVLSNNSWNNRHRSIAFTHRVMVHSVRSYVMQYYNSQNIKINIFNDDFSQPTDEEELHWWSHTGRRHSNKYYQFIASHKLMDAHGGYFLNNSVKDFCQWDSWKFWEGFLCGCAVIAADLDYYKINLPVPLTPYVHYLPVRYDNINESYKKIMKLSDSELKKIARTGREYVLQHYSPKEFSKYIIEQIEN